MEDTGEFFCLNALQTNMKSTWLWPS